jgi:hypothetical protein
MRILFVLSIVAPAAIGGSNLAVAQISNDLIKIGDVVRYEQPVL